MSWKDVLPHNLDFTLKYFLQSIRDLEISHELSYIQKNFVTFAGCWNYDECSDREIDWSKLRWIFFPFFDTIILFWALKTRYFRGLIFPSWLEKHFLIERDESMGRIAICRKRVFIYLSTFSFPSVNSCKIERALDNIKCRKLDHTVTISILLDSRPRSTKMLEWNRLNGKTVKFLSTEINSKYALESSILCIEYNFLSDRSRSFFVYFSASVQQIPLVDKN